jgi:hypothetical protein
MSELDEARLRHPSSGQLQEVIATNTLRSFNSGVQRGELQERERILKVIKSFTATACICDNCNTARDIARAIND